MAASAVWTAMKDWVASARLPAADLNTYLRDPMTYLKGILDGTSLQDVTIAGARAFKHGTQAVMRGDGATKEHVESATASAVLGGSANTVTTVTWAKPFSSAPAVASGVSGNGAEPWQVGVAVYAITTTGATVKLSNISASGQTVTATIIALGPD